MILEEVNLPYPRCPKCDMFVYQQSFNSRYPINSLCQEGKERKRKRLGTEEVEAGVSVALTACGRPLTEVPSFKYLGRILSVSDDDWPVVIRNLRRALNKWACLSRVLVWEGADARTLGMFYTTVFQAVLLYRS